MGAHDKNGGGGPLSTAVMLVMMLEWRGDNGDLSIVLFYSVS